MKSRRSRPLPWKRLGRALEAALAALSRHDRADTARDGDAAYRPSPAAPSRQRLVEEASDALWCFIVSAKLAAFATNGWYFASTACPQKCEIAWACSAPAALGMNEFMLS